MTTSVHAHTIPGLTPGLEPFRKGGAFFQHSARMVTD